MRLIFSSFLVFFTLMAFSQESINYHNGNFDSALSEAKESDKDIFFITRSESCPVFDVFNENLKQDTETIEFLNKEFIIFEFDMDKANEKEIKQLKKYYHSWRGFPQLYFIDKNEKLISDIVYTLNYSHKENLSVWKNYKQIEKEWKVIKKNKRKNLNRENLRKFLFYRHIKYSPYDLMQIQNVIGKYFKKIDKEDYSNSENWFLFEEHIQHYSNPTLFDFVARNKKEFQKKNGSEKISKYLTGNYVEMVSWMSKEERKLAVKEYPFNTISEAKKALENYKEIEPIFKLNTRE